MDFSQVKSLLNFNAEEEDNFKKLWEDSEKTFPVEIPECLMESYLRESFAKIQYQEDLSDELVEVAQKIVQIPELYHWVWHIIYRTFFHPEGGLGMPFYTIPDSVLGERAKGLVNLIIALACIKPVEYKFKEMGIPVEYALKQHRWIAGTIDIYRHAHHGLPGHTLQQTSWLRLGIRGRLFRVGRFEYALENSYLDYLPIIYKNREDGSLVYFAQDGWTVGADDMLCQKEEAVRTLTFWNADGKLIGTRLRFNGKFDQEKTELNAAEYEALSAPWDLPVSCHIPGGERMPLEAVKKSLKEAYVFFQKYLHRDIPFFFCNSWILNPEWQKRLPGSNLADFQKSVFLIPSSVHYPNDGVFFIFGTPEVSLDTVPENKIQRTMLDVLKEGKPLRNGTAVIPSCRLDQIGHPENF